VGTKKLKDLGKGVVVSKRCADRSRVIDEAIEEDPSRQEWAGFALFLEPQGAHRVITYSFAGAYDVTLLTN
jgi:hypothetical protein